MTTPPRLPDNRTHRLWLSYSVDNVGHDMMVRFFGAGTTAIAAADQLAAILGFVSGSLPPNWQAESLRTSAANTDFSTPVDINNTDLGGFVGTATSGLDANLHPRQATWVGRSPSTGSYARLTLYGFLGTTPANFRYGPGEHALSSAPVIAALNAGSVAGYFRAADGSVAVWFPYVNIQNNSYWETQRRNG